MSICRREKCNNPIPSDAHHNTTYCSPECYRKQNAEEAKISQEKRRDLTTKTKVCERKGCSVVFTLKRMGGTRMYCSDKCKDEVSLARRKGTRRVKKEVKHTNKCKDCGTDVAYDSVRCLDCSTYTRYGNRNTERYKGTMDAKWTTPRGSKQRKALGLPPLDFGVSRGYGLEVGA